MEAEAMHDVYLARCKDTNERPSLADAKHFRNAIPMDRPDVAELRGLRLGPSAATALSKALRSASEIAKLDVYGNVIRDGGITSIVQLLKWNRHIQHVNLGCNDLRDRGVQLIAAALGNDGIQIRSLNLGIEDQHWHVNHISHVGATALARALQRNSFLTGLSLRGNDIGIEDNEDMSVALAQMLQANDTLRYLNLAANKVQLTLSLDIIESLCLNNTLTHLDLSNNDLPAETGLAIGDMLKVNHSLTHVILKDNQLGDRGMSAIAEALEENTTLIMLDVEGNQIGNESIKDLANALYTNSTLIWLNLARNCIEEYAGVFLAAALCSNAVLTTLKLADNPVRDDTIKELASALALPDCALLHLDLRRTKLADEGALALAGALQQNETLQVLRLNDNFITTIGGADMVEALGDNETLLVIDARGNQLEHADVLALKGLMRRNKAAVKERELAPLQEEIVRLKVQQQKLADTQVALQKEQAEREQAQRHVNLSEAKLAMLKADEQLHVSHLQSQMDAQAKLLKSAEMKLREKESILAGINAEYDAKQSDMRETMDKESAKREMVERALTERTMEYNRLQSEHVATVARMKGEADRLYTEAEQMREQSKKLRDDLAAMIAARRAALRKDASPRMSPRGRNTSSPHMSPRGSAPPSPMVRATTTTRTPQQPVSRPFHAGSKVPAVPL